MNKYDQETRDKAAAMREDGTSYRAIAKALGVGPTIVHLWLNPEAKERHLERTREWRKLNPEKIRDGKRNWNAINSEKINKNAREHYASDADFRKRMCEYSHEYYSAHREEVLRRVHKWVQNNREKVRKYNRISWHRHRAFKKNTTIGSLPARYDDALYEDQHGLCYYCGASLEETGQHIEHMTPLSRGGAHALYNLVLSCPTCNLRKHTKTAEEFIEQRRLQAID